MSDKLFDMMEVRRTYYAISNRSSIPDSKLQTIVEEAVTHTPSPFNMQSGRAVLLTGDAHERMWSVVRDTYVEVVPGDDDAKKAACDKIDMEYAAGYGTVMFFEDTAVIDAFSGRLPHMKAFFPSWSENLTGMLQFAVWTALSNEGLGASLQHFGAYSPETQSAVLKEFDLPATWKSTAMMPFGIPTGPPGNAARPKTFEPIEGRVKVILGSSKSEKREANVGGLLRQRRRAASSAGREADLGYKGRFREERDLQPMPPLASQSPGRSSSSKTLLPTETTAQVLPDNLHSFRQPSNSGVPRTQTRTIIQIERRVEVITEGPGIELMGGGGRGLCGRSRDRQDNAPIRMSPRGKAL